MFIIAVIQVIVSFRFLDFMLMELFYDLFSRFTRSAWKHIKTETNKNELDSSYILQLLFK